MDYFIITLVLIWLIAATIHDLRKREISNWLNFSLLIFGLAYQFYLTLFKGDYTIILNSLAGLGIFFLAGLGLFAIRGVGGGDAKLLFALGPVMPNPKLALIFLLIFILTAGFYSLFFGMLKEKNPKKSLKIDLPLAPSFLISYIIFIPVMGIV